MNSFETDADCLQQVAREHLWLHFSRMGSYGPAAEIPIIVSGEGCYLTDGHGKRYLDALAGLFAVQIGYSHGEEIGQAALEQMRELPFYTSVGLRDTLGRSSSRSEICRPARRRSRTDIFFTSGGSEAVERPGSSRASTTRYAASGAGRRSRAISPTTGQRWGRCDQRCARSREPFEPLVPSVARVSNTNRYRRPASEQRQNTPPSCSTSSSGRSYARDPRRSRW